MQWDLPSKAAAPERTGAEMARSTTEAKVGTKEEEEEEGSVAGNISHLRFSSNSHRRFV